MAFKVTLNGANYVSEARQQQFQRALETLPERPPALPTPPASVKVVESNGGNGGNGHANSASPSEAAYSPPVPAPVHAVAAHAAVDPVRVLEGLEWGLQRSYDHQSEMLQVHQHYLANEAGYAGIFAQLVREQSTLFAGDTARTEHELRVLESLARSMEQFHQHQSETLSTHSQFLAQQAAYAQSFVDVLRHQYGAALYGNGHGNGNGNGHSNGNGSSDHAQPAAYRAVPGPAVAPPPSVPQPRSGPAVQAAQAVQTAPTVQAAPAQADLRAPVLSPRAAVVSPAPGGPDLSQDLLAIVSEKTGYPVEMLELGMDMEADLGIDSIKRVEILGALQDMHPELPEVDTDALAELRTLAQVVAYTETRSQAAAIAAAAPAVAPAPAPTFTEPAAQSVSGLSDELLAIVSEKTGYPAEMLEMGMDMEADLGIDSIKRVEILGALQDSHPGLPEVETDALAELRTLAQILDYVQAKAGAAPIAAAGAAKKA